MARPLRLEFAGALYHITARGNRREWIYETDEDRTEFLSLLSEVCQDFNWACHAFCLMGNHYHLLIETPEGNLSRGMRMLNGVYTQRFNRRHRRVGHFFQGRYKAILVEKESYLLELVRYILLNPVRAEMVRISTRLALEGNRMKKTNETEAPGKINIDLLSKFLGIAASGLTLLTASFFLLGCLLIWYYLHSQNLTKEFCSLVASPPIVITTAIYAFVASTYAVVILIISPTILHQLTDGLDILVWSDTNGRKRCFFYFLSLVVPAVVFIFLASLGIQEYIWIDFLFITFVFSLLYYRYYGGPSYREERHGFQKWKKSFLHFICAFLALLLIYFMVLVAIILFSKVVLVSSHREVLQWIVFIIIFSLYALFVAIAASNRNITSFIPLVLLAVAVTVVLMITVGEKNIITRIGFGAFSATYVVEEKGLAALPDQNLYKDKIVHTKYKGVVLLRKIWVVASDSTKLIVRPSENHGKTYDLYKSSVIGEIN